MPSDLHHLRREVDPDHLPSQLVQVSGNMPRPAAEVGDSSGRRRLHKGGQKRSVEGLVVELLEEMARILLGDPVVAVARSLID